MAYTLAQMIARAENGLPIKITSVPFNTDVCLEIGGTSIQLSRALKSKTVSGQVITSVQTDTHVLDLGTLFTAVDVLESTSLKRAVSSGVVLATAGIVELTVVPTATQQPTSLSSSSSSSSCSCSSSSCSCSSSSCSSSSCSCSSSSCSSSFSSCSSSSCSSSSSSGT